MSDEQDQLYLVNLGDLEALIELVAPTMGPVGRLQFIALWVDENMHEEVELEFDNGAE